MFDMGDKSPKNKAKMKKKVDKKKVTTQPDSLLSPVQAK
jgi:hypothetical protein